MGVGALILGSLLTGLAAAVIEMLHGVFRVKFLNPRFGDRASRRIGVFSGSALLFVLSWWSAPWLNPESTAGSALVTGSIWLLMLLALDLGVGRFVFRFRWRRMLEDFNPAKGNLLAFGMAFAFFCPLLVAFLRSR